MREFVEGLSFEVDVSCTSFSASNKVTLVLLYHAAALFPSFSLMRLFFCFVLLKIKIKLSHCTKLDLRIVFCFLYYFFLYFVSTNENIKQTCLLQLLTSQTFFSRRCRRRRRHVSRGGLN